MEYIRPQIIGPYDVDALKWGYEGVAPEILFDPYAHYYQDLVEFISTDVPKERSSNAKTKVGYRDLSILLAAILPMKSKFYDASRFEQVKAIAEKVAALDISSQNDQRVAYYVYNFFAHRLPLNVLSSYAASPGDFHRIADLSLRMLDNIAKSHGDKNVRMKRNTYSFIAIKMVKSTMPVDFRRNFLKTLINQLKIHSENNEKIKTENKEMIRILTDRFSEIK